MANYVTSVPSVTAATETPAGGFGAFTRNPNPPEPDPSHYRLTIEEGPGGFVYKTRDPVTGEVIRQFPREEVLKLQASPNYLGGRVIDTSI